VHLEPQLPPLEADRWQMVQAIVNILQNAADAMTDASQRLLTVVVSVAHGRLRIAISDTGSGILPGNISRIFEPFFTTKNERGTGLGLYITKQVVEEHRGVVTVDTGNRGTTFTIALPLNGVSK
jgi:signal transduction histidine kinase